jgi:DNA mismatch repair ATPase MutS
VADICGILKEMDDVSRLCQRFLLGRADFNDLIAIKSAIGTWETLKQNCQNEKLLEAAENRLPSYSSEWASVASLLQRMNDLTDLYNKISEAVIINCDSTELSLGEESNVVEGVDSNDQMPSAGKLTENGPSIPGTLFLVCNCFTL